MRRFVWEGLFMLNFVYFGMGCIHTQLFFIVVNGLGLLTCLSALSHDR
jgi:hypothetical protein